MIKLLDSLSAPTCSFIDCAEFGSVFAAVFMVHLCAIVHNGQKTANHSLQFYSVVTLAVEAKLMGWEKKIEGS
ncbi:hypothetical protein RIF29_31626 [Crotalaria pallida]|uniref:Uncharacterized protein n=1 Tax=Crotalaria pallida TaxID=3830 RepID=A0AAN9EI78_CROPI